MPQRKTASNGSQTSPIPGEYGAEVAAFGRSLRARNRSAKTIRSYLDTANLFGQYLIDAGETTDFATITKAKVETFITDQLERWSASTAATRYRCLQQFFRFLVDNEVIADSPMARMSPPAIPEAPVPVFTNDELIRLRKACEGRGSPAAATSRSCAFSSTPRSASARWPVSGSKTSTSKPSESS